ncbi:MAG: hypothetical protein IJ816_05255 [Alloprevotella sp.]|nr:hypothetical protein [Alloprevotella sp.]
MKKKVITPLPEKDFRLFEDMSDKYVSEPERKFFETLRQREEDYAINWDWLINEHKNPEHISLIRYYNSEYKVGCLDTNGKYYRIAYVDSLAEALEVVVPVAGNRLGSLVDWLRNSHYTYVSYNGVEEL